jgi:pimeloyl-ACP methyl ester carboxylesterase
MRLARPDGVSIHVRLDGPRTAPPVLFIHGFPFSGEMWASTVSALEDRFLCVTPDLRGHGLSDPARDAESATIATYADDCAAALAECAPGRPGVICGLSMGGIIALEFFRSHRGLVRALVLCDTRANPETPEGITMREQRARLALEKGAAGVRQIADAMIQNILAPDHDPGVRDAVQAMMVGTDPVGLAAASRALGMRPDARPTLPRIDVPTLLIVGEEDAITPPELMRDVQRSVPGSRLVVIPGAGHVPPLERPEDFNGALRAFVERLA